MSKRLFREIIIWKEIDDDTVSRYRCFHVLPDNKYFVKGRDFFHYPLDEKQLRDMEFYAIDSLFQGGLNMEENFCDSLEEGIEKFDKDFE
jgi:hypothetical protein